MSISWLAFIQYIDSCEGTWVLSMVRRLHNYCMSSNLCQSKWQASYKSSYKIIIGIVRQSAVSYHYVWIVLEYHDNRSALVMLSLMYLPIHVVTYFFAIRSPLCVGGWCMMYVWYHCDFFACTGVHQFGRVLSCGRELFASYTTLLGRVNSEKTFCVFIMCNSICIYSTCIVLFCEHSYTDAICVY